MSILALDLETSSLIPENIAKGSDQFPWFVQIGCVLFDLQGKTLALFGSNVRADGRRVHDGAAAVHGITNAQAGRSGISEIAALAVASGFAAQAKYITGYNVRFDLDVIESALIRLNKSTRMLVRAGLEVIDLIQPAAQVCKIPSTHDSGGYRWPKLDVASEVIRGERPRNGAHNALADARRSQRLFLSLYRRKIIEVAT